MQVRSVNRGQKAVSLPIPAPVGGLNARDALAAMPPNDASVLSNQFPFADRVETRPGYSLLATATSITEAGTEEGFRALMSWAGGSQSDTVFAAFRWTEDVAGTDYGRLRIYSVAADGTLATSLETLATGTVNTAPILGEWTQFGSGAGTSYLIVAFGYRNAGNVLFSPKAYDGSSWSAPTITGAPSTALPLGVHSHRRRLWYYNWDLDANALRAYYLPVNSIAGALTLFDLSPYATKGGRIIAMRTWTLDGGDGGSDDLAVFITTKGQAIVYEGTDPASASTWRLVGVFDVGNIASFTTADGYAYRKDSVALKYGADLLLLTNEGLTSANRVFRPMGSEGGDYSLSAKIRPLLTDAATAWANSSIVSTSFASWKLVHFAPLRQLIVSVPTARTEVDDDPISYQITTDWYVMNTETGAWTKFSGLNSFDALAVGTSLYFIDGTRAIYKFGSAASDNGTAITFECRQAYNYLNSPNNKLVALMQPMLRATGNFSLTVEADADFNGGTISSYTSYTVSGTTNLQPWLSPAKYGRTIATHMKGQTSAGVVTWYATNYLAQPAGPI